MSSNGDSLRAARVAAERRRPPARTDAAACTTLHGSGTWARRARHGPMPPLARGRPRAHRLRRRTSPGTLRRRARRPAGTRGRHATSPRRRRVEARRPPLDQRGLGAGCHQDPVDRAIGPPRARVPARVGRAGRGLRRARRHVGLAPGRRRRRPRRARAAARDPVPVRVHRRRDARLRPLRCPRGPRGRLEAGRRLGAAERGAVRARRPAGQVARRRRARRSCGASAGAAAATTASWSIRRRTGTGPCPGRSRPTSSRCSTTSPRCSVRAPRSSC